jgi:hypothetical protein
MKLKVRADSKDMLIFLVFCVVLLYLVAIAVVNLNSFAVDGVFLGLNPIPAFVDFLFPTLEVIIFNLAISADTIDIYYDFISLKLNKKYCPLNPYFYCYACGKVFVLNVYFQMYIIVIIIKKNMIIYNLDKN